jgi:predicted dehydrogenase
MPMNLAIVGFAHAHVDAYAAEIRTMSDARIAWGWDHDAQRGAAEETTTVVGDRGTIIQSYGDGPSCGGVALPENPRGLKYVLAGENHWTVVDIPSPPSHGHRIRGVARPAVDFFLGKRGPMATAEEGRANVQMLLSAYQSATEGRRIEIA